MSEPMTEDQIGLITAASVLRTRAAELHAILNFIGKQVIEEARSPETEALPDIGKIMTDATIALYSIESVTRGFRDKFEPLIDRRAKGVLKGQLLQPFSVWFPATNIATAPLSANVVNFAAERDRRRK